MYIYLYYILTSTPIMIGDKQPIILKCFKNKKKFRTYVFNAEQHFNTIDECYKILAKIKKALGTSMEVKSASENADNLSAKDDKKKNNLKTTDNQHTNDDCASGDGDIPENEPVCNLDKVQSEIDNNVSAETEAERKKKRKKMKKADKKPNYINDPVFSFGGDQITKIITFLTSNKYIDGECIKV